ncbi:uncharacterized protein PV06_03883 [Exophiala oligosperma]|uniref:Uncharacterized protein n=1 Tax=Exophiala oligosperma TaxID=215243 RepID=A0A0D2C6X3_9EURO|nr:uncharacterized protein PV06_03883 [Exophiala oligosperma]KIW45497.1 hypothetical protein PV06_03883 [Exophiala oligosperma]
MPSPQVQRREPFQPGFQLRPDSCNCYLNSSHPSTLQLLRMLSNPSVFARARARVCVQNRSLLATGTIQHQSTDPQYASVPYRYTPYRQKRPTRTQTTYHYRRR